MGLTTPGRACRSRCRSRSRRRVWRTSSSPRRSCWARSTPSCPSGLGEYRQWVGANTDIHGHCRGLRRGGSTRRAMRPVVRRWRGHRDVGHGRAGRHGRASLLTCSLRDRARAGGLLRAASKMGLQPRFVDIELARRPLDALCARGRGGVDDPGRGRCRAGLRLRDEPALSVSGRLLDVVYAPLVTPLCDAWADAGGTAVSGTRMLLHQAGEQVRLMTGLVRAPRGDG